MDRMKMRTIVPPIAMHGHTHSAWSTYHVLHFGRAVHLGRMDDHLAILVKVEGRYVDEAYVPGKRTSENDKEFMYPVASILTCESH